MYLDYHAHANISNVFMFGNNLPFHKHVESCLFPFLLSVTSPLFDIQSCNFSKKNMKKNEEGDLNKSKNGTGKLLGLSQEGGSRCTPSTMW